MIIASKASVAIGGKSCDRSHLNIGTPLDALNGRAGRNMLENPGDTGERGETISVAQD
jgi:hypothetical protein